MKRTFEHDVLLDGEVVAIANNPVGIEMFWTHYEFEFTTSDGDVIEEFRNFSIWHSGRISFRNKVTKEVNRHVFISNETDVFSENFIVRGTLELPKPQVDWFRIPKAVLVRIDNLDDKYFYGIALVMGVLLGLLW